MELVSRLDDRSKLLWRIAAVVVSFYFWWPVGLLVLGFLLFSGGLRPMMCMGAGRWHNMEHRRQRRGGQGPGGFCGRASGNKAFDEYREQTLQRLEEEQREFQEYLERLRQARDKAEFDQFMAERRNGPAAPGGPDQV